jgi:hypothetical protein
VRHPDCSAPSDGHLDIGRSINEAERRLAEAKRVLPELQRKCDASFPQHELDEKMARLEDVNRQLAAKPTVSDMRPGPVLRAPNSALNARCRFARMAPLLFAHAKNDDAGTVDHHAVPISDSAMVIARVQAAFARRVGAALPVGIQKVRGMDDLPPALQAAARRQQLDLGKGVYFENVVYVVQQAHGTAEEVEKTIFHELYGHAATASLFGGEWLAKQNALLGAWPRKLTSMQGRRCRGSCFRAGEPHLVQRMGNDRPYFLQSRPDIG